MTVSPGGPQAIFSPSPLQSESDRHLGPGPQVIVSGLQIRPVAQSVWDTHTSIRSDWIKDRVNKQFRFQFRSARTYDSLNLTGPIGSTEPGRAE